MAHALQMLLALTCGLACGALSVASAQQPSFGRLLANEGRQLFLFDAQGNQVWKHQLKAAPHDLHVLPSGNILTHQGTEVIELDPQTHEVVWSFESRSLATAPKVELHAVAPLPGGRIMVALSGEGKIFEIDREGQVKHQIKMKLDRPHPHRDTRLVRPLDDGGYLVAHEGDGKVREYSCEGEVIWEYEIPMFGQAAKGGHGPEAFGNAVFSAIRLENGNTLIGTGNGHRVLEVSPEKKIVWQIEQSELPGITLAWVTTLEVHADGTRVIGNCHAGPDQPQLVAVSPEKKVLWTFADFEHLGNSVSNSQLLDEQGQAISNVIR